MSATADEVLEAMARATHNANCGGFRPWDDLARASAEGNTLAAVVMEEQRDAIRAAIRALPPGWVVAQVPERMPFYHDDTDARVFEKRGHNAALAAVRASAVEVE